MKVNLPVTGVEQPFTSGTIVSKTDLKGTITYANDAFVALSGFTREELLGKNHNLVRHPDMPPAAFKWLWDTIRLGKPWQGIVKNRCKNGDHYWVKAFVVPVYKDGEIVEYMSVRSPPSREEVAGADALYKAINAGQSFTPPKTRRLTIKQAVVGLVGFNALLLAASGVLGYTGNHGLNALLIGAGVLASLAVGVWTSGAIDRGLGRIIHLFKRIGEGHLANDIPIDGDDEPGRVLAALAAMQVHLKVILDEVALAAKEIASSSQHLNQEMERLRDHAGSQADRVMQASAAMEEMSVAVREVAESAQQAAGAAAHTQEVVAAGGVQMENSMAATGRVVEAVETSSTIIGELNRSVQRIGDITNAIKEIADQTNLLALNAAIEAARAGEQGRGFAVVADEVRKLAERTANSTADITAMVESINAATGAAVSSMEQAGREVQQGLTLIQASNRSLAEIRDASDQVTSMAQHIAQASNQQSAAGEEVSDSMATITRLAEESSESIARVGEAIGDLARVAGGLEDLVSHFDQH